MLKQKSKKIEKWIIRTSLLALIITALLLGLFTDLRCDYESKLGEGMPALTEAQKLLDLQALNGMRGPDTFAKRANDLAQKEK